MPRPVKFGVTLPQIKRTWPEARAAAIEFESLGYDSLWVCDHLYGVPAPTIPILEAWSELAAVAAITERCQLGSLVTPPLFRTTTYAPSAPKGPGGEDSTKEPSVRMLGRRKTCTLPDSRGNATCTDGWSEPGSSRVE